MNEHPFNLYPESNKFYISHDSKHIMLFLMNDNEGSDQVDRVRILDINTLALVDEINMRRFPPIYQNDLVEAHLLWNSSYLYY